MEAVGVTDLKRHASAIIKRVREEKEVVNVTYRGKVVARIVPSDGGNEPHTRTDPPRSEHLTGIAKHVQGEQGRRRAILRAQIEATLAERRRLRDESGKWGTDPVDAVELVREQRRDFGDRQTAS